MTTSTTRPDAFVSCTHDPSRFGTWVEVGTAETGDRLALRSFVLDLPADDRDVRIAQAATRCALSVAAEMHRQGTAEQ